MAQHPQRTAAFFSHFETLQETRLKRCRVHPRRTIIFIAVCAMLSGANGFVAMGCQKASAAKIRERGVDYVLAVKGNQEHVEEDVMNYFGTLDDGDKRCAPRSRCHTTERGRQQREEAVASGLECSKPGKNPGPLLGLGNAIALDRMLVGRSAISDRWKSS